MTLEIRPLKTNADAEACARLMSSMEPWVTLGRRYEDALSMVTDPSREVYVAEIAAGPCGFLILCMVGALVGYIQTVLVAPDQQRRGIGRRLLAHAEERIFIESPNAFLMVSSFNPDARRLYERVGYSYVGELPDYLIVGHSELLFRKTRGPRNAVNAALG